MKWACHAAEKSEIADWKLARGGKRNFTVLDLYNALTLEAPSLIVKWTSPYRTCHRIHDYVKLVPAYGIAAERIPIWIGTWI